MQLNEHITERSEVIKDNLPKGVLARVWYKIMRFGKKNANKRVYERACAERVLSDKDVCKKLNTRTLYGDQEHPEFSQLKLNWQTTSHIISEMRINDNDGTLEAAFDILPTEPGKFINVLLEAGCQVGVSTRADGELREAIDESGERYHIVVPEKYIFRSVDFTGDPSTPDTVPEKIIRATQENYEAKVIDKNVAVALLEYVNTPEAKKLLMAVQEDKQHDGCDLSLDKKKCSSGCLKGKKEALKNLLSDTLPESVIQVGSPVKVNERVGVVSHLFPRTKKAVIQFATTKETFPIDECKLIEEISYVDSKTEKMALKLFNKSYRDLTFQEKEQVLFAKENNKEDTTGVVKDTDTNEIIPPVKEIPSIQPEIGFYKDGKGELLYVQEVKDGKVTIARQSGNKETMSVEEFQKLEVKKDATTTFPNEKSKEAIEQEKFEMEESIDKALSLEEKKETNEATIEEPSSDSADTESDVEFEGHLWKKPFEFLKQIPQDLIDTWTPSQQYIFKQVVRRKELGEAKKEYVEFVEESKDFDITEAYLNELLIKDEEISRLRTDLFNIKESIKNKKTEVETLLKEHTDQINKCSIEIDETLKKNKYLSDTLKEQKEKLTKDIALREADILNLSNEIKESNEVKIGLEKSIEDLKESHRKDILRVYTEARIKGLGLKLSKSTLSLFEGCETIQEIDEAIRHTQNGIREGIVRQNNGINEIVQESQLISNPTQKKIDKHISNVLKNLGI